jgi:ribonuclease BN (tRNA processing enzyme)
MAATLTLLGVGNAFDPAPNSSALVQADGFTLVIDCGFSAAPALWRRLPEADAVDALVLTHHHADHCFGVVPWLDRMAYNGRRRRFTIATTEWGFGHLHRLMEAGFMTEGRLPFGIDWLDITQARQVGPFGLAVAQTRHAVVNHALRLERDGTRLAWSGDGRPTPESLALYAEADLLMHECDTVASDPPSEIHADLACVSPIAGPRRIGLYHIAAAQRDAMRARVAGDARLFVPEAGDTLDW